MQKLNAIMLLMLCGLSARNQPFPDLRFVQLTERDGLSCDKTTSITQDANGVIWVSTNNGLNRFDGYGFTRFFANRGDSSTIPANEIELIEADRRNYLWIQSAAGVCRFNTATYKVDRFDSGHRTPATFRNFENAHFWFDSHGDAYVVAPTDLFHFKNEARYIAEDEEMEPFVLEQALYTHFVGLVSDRHGGLWGYAGNRIYRVDPATRRAFSTFSIGEEVSVTGLCFDNQDRCWASTWEGGILQIGPAGLVDEVPGIFRKMVIQQGVPWTFNGHQYLVFGTNKPGVLLLDPATGRCRSYLDEKVGGVQQPFVDRQNTLWIPTAKGLFYVNASATLFDLIRLSRNPRDFPDTLYGATPYSMRETKSGLWVGRRYQGGMFQFTNDWRLVHAWAKPVDSVGPQYHDGPATTREAYDFRQVGDTMYVTTEWGMMLLNLNTFHRTMVRDEQRPPVMRLRTIVPETNSRWWIRSFSQGIYIFDASNNKFVRHYGLNTGNCAGCGPASANYLIRDHKGRVFVTTNAGLFKYEPALDSFVVVHLNDNQTFGNSLFGLVEDRSGIIWIGLDAGVCAYNADSNKIVREFSEDNGIGPVERIGIDSAQNLWFRSINGYWCWLRGQDRLIQFRIRDGLPDNDEGLIYTAANGNVYAGCTGGIVWFHADQLARYSVSADVRIMDALTGDRPLPITTGSKGEKRVLLNPNQHNLRVIFDVVNYDMPQNNLFYYRLSPAPGDWTQVDNGRLSFDNLAPGEYTLTVRGGNKLTGLFTTTDSLALTILPYWYQSSWFRALVGLAILGLIFLAVRWRISHIHHEAEFRQRIADTELQALRAQMNPHFIFNSLNSIENFIMKNEKWLASDYLNKFARLFRMILHSSRNELVPFTKDLEALQLYVDLERLRYGNRFEYETDIDPQLIDGEYRVPSLLIQPYVENAIVHGLGLSTRNDGYVQVSATLNGEYICYRITDNGVGRMLAREVRQLNSPNHRSFGLAITENRINIFSHQQNSSGRVTITDLSNEDGTAAGTRVEVLIKAV